MTYDRIAPALPEQVKEIPLIRLNHNHGFLEKVEEHLKNTEPDTHVLVAVDIEHFKLYNKLYGRDGGDRLLVYVAECLRQITEEYDGLAGYFGGDNFCILMPNLPKVLGELLDTLADGIRQMNHTAGFLPAFGIYQITDPSDNPAVMYDRAMIALSHVFGNYAKRIRIYDSSMVEKLEEELLLISEIQDGLENGEFFFYIQPQCDITTGKIVGAESLIRWNRGNKEIIPPGVFIPILEKNGFIADLDKYVWEEVCRWLRDWTAKGNVPVPVSVNVSRIDFFSLDVAEYLNKLVHRYQVSAGMLKIEITESAYAEDDDRINLAVKRLREYGFYVMMDDFGSGYSSLNMLKSIPVDVLKIDMRFLDIKDNEAEKGYGILESVVNMSRQMGLPIIVEGVETELQEQFLTDMGCHYAQGYYYYRPMPVEEFEKILIDPDNLDTSGLRSLQEKFFDPRELLDTHFIGDQMFNNIVGPAAICDVYGEEIVLARVNERFREEFSDIWSDMSLWEDGQQMSQRKVHPAVWKTVSDEEYTVLESLFHRAHLVRMKGARGLLHFCGEKRNYWVYLTVFFVKKQEGHEYYYVSFTDLSILDDGTQNAYML